MFEKIVSHFYNNDFFSGGLIITLLAGSGYYLKPFIFNLWRKITRLIIYSVYVDQHDEFYYHLNEWLYKKRKNSFRNVQIKTSNFSFLFKRSKNNPNPYYLFHKDDSFLLWYNGWPLNIVKNQQNLQSATRIDDFLYNSYTIKTFFNKKLIVSFLEEIIKHTNKKDSVNVFTNLDNYWNSTLNITLRYLESIVLFQKYNIIDDISFF